MVALTRVTVLWFCFFRCVLSILPPMGWSSWNSVQYLVNDSFIRESAEALSQNLAQFGYNYILIDDGWPLCDQYASDHSCTKTHARDPTTNEIVVDPKKFPHGFQNLSDFVHSLGLKLGIYTSVSQLTCGGFSGSLGYEAIDAQSFVRWGFDFVKHDTCSDEGEDHSNCGTRNGCIQNSTFLMASALKQYSSAKAKSKGKGTESQIVYYVDDGNPSTSYRLFNPRSYHCTDANTIKLAQNSDQLIYEWVNKAPFFDDRTNTSLLHMFKSWFDREDSWHSVLDNLHHQIGLAVFQKCSLFNMADMLTTAQGRMSFTQYRAEFLLWSVLSTPLILGATLPQLLADKKVLDLITNSEIIGVNQDSECTQASMLRMWDSSEMWGKVVSGGDVVVVVVNKDASKAASVTVRPFGYESDFYPMFEDFDGGTFKVRDLVNHKDLGSFISVFVANVNAHDAVMLKFSDFKTL